jgi:hypothetical protein
MANNKNEEDWKKRKLTKNKGELKKRKITERKEDWE